MGGGMSMPLVVMLVVARDVRMRVVAHTSETASRIALQHIDNSQPGAAANGSQQWSAARQENAIDRRRAGVPSLTAAGSRYSCGADVHHDGNRQRRAPVQVEDYMRESTWLVERNAV
jgi:hypothetical protein